MGETAALNNGSGMPNSKSGHTGLTTSQTTTNFATLENIYASPSLHEKLLQGRFFIIFYFTS